MTKSITMMLVLVLMASFSACTLKETTQTRGQVEPQESVVSQAEKEVEEAAGQQENATQPKKSTDGVDNEDYLKNPLHHQIVKINGKEYIYDAGLEIWMEYLGEDKIPVLTITHYTYF